MNKYDRESLPKLTDHELALLYEEFYEKPLTKNDVFKTEAERGLFAINLLTEIGARFAIEHKHNPNELRVGNDVWYVNTEEGIVEHGVVTEVSHLGSYFDIRFDEEDIDTFDLKYFGKVVFPSKTEADIVLGRYKINKEMA